MANQQNVVTNNNKECQTTSMFTNWLQPTHKPHPQHLAKSSSQQNRRQSKSEIENQVVSIGLAQKIHPPLREAHRAVFE